METKTLGKRKESPVELKNARKTKLIKLTPEMTKLVVFAEKKKSKRGVGTSSLESMPHDKAEACLNDLSVAITGARPMEIMVGISKATTGGCVVRLASDSAIVKPHWGRIIGICQYEDLRSRYLKKLGDIPFFALMEPEERFNWISSHASRTKDFDIASEPGDPVKVQIIQSGGKLATDIVDQDELRALMQSEDAEHLEAKTVYGLFKTKSLFWLRQMWKIAIHHKLVTETKHMVMDAIKGETLTGKILSEQEQQTMEMFEINYDLGKLAVLVPKPNAQTDPVMNLQHCLDLVHRHGMVVDIPVSCQTACRAVFELVFTCLNLGFFKSQLQKMIRLPAGSIDFSDFEQETRQFYAQKYGRDLDVKPKDFFVPLPYALLMCMSYVISHSGIFVANIQKFVTGLESLIRRLNIIKAEDAFITIRDTTIMFKMASCLLLAQRVSSWKPTMSQVNEWFMLGTDSLFQLSCLVYDVERGKKMDPFRLVGNNKIKLTNFQTVSAILEDGGMEGDHGMLRFLGRRHTFTDEQKLSVDPIKGPDSIKVYCAIDQHCAADFLYFYPDLPLLATHVDTKTKYVFGPFLKKGFEQVSGVNLRKSMTTSPEKTWTSDFESRPFVQKYRFAQLAYLKRALEQPASRGPSFENYIVSIFKTKYELDIGWLACAVSVISLEGSLSHLIVTMDTEDPTRLIVGRKPTRETKQESIPADEEERAIAQARRKLMNDGIVWFKGKSHAEPPLREWVGAKVCLDRKTNQYMVSLLKPEEKEEEKEENSDEDGDVKMKKKNPYLFPVPWEDLRHVSVKVPVVKMAKPNAYETLSASHLMGNYIHHDAFEQIQDLVSKMSLSTIRAMKTVMTGFNTKFEMGRISMDGSSTAQPVNLSDIYAFQFLCQLCVLVPAAICHDRGFPTRFLVLNGPLLWHIRDQVIYPAANKRAFEVYNKTAQPCKWPLLSESESKRVFREYQEDSHRKLVEAASNGQTFHILQMTVGSGKSLVGIRTFQSCVEELKIPFEYCVVVCPGSVAVEQVKEWEMEGFKGKIDVVLPIKKVSDALIKTFGKLIHHIPDQHQVLRRGRVSIVDYNHLKQLQDRLLTIAPKTFFLFDEMHKIVEEKTLRTNICQRLVTNALMSMGMTGTLVIDADTHRIVIWLKYILKWPVTDGNFMVAVSHIVSKLAPPTAKCIEYDVQAKWPSPEFENYYKSFISPAFGGIRDRPSQEHHMQALNCCYSATLTEMAKLAKLWYQKSPEIAWFSSDEYKFVTQEQKITSNGLFVVVKDNAQVDRFYDMVTQGEFKCCEPNEVRKIEVAGFRLTDDDVEKKLVSDYKMVIAPQTKTLGYTLVRLAGILCGTWPSNLATREQRNGRVARDRQRRKFIPVIQVAIGIQELIRTGKHASAQGLFNALTVRSERIEAM